MFPDILRENEKPLRRERVFRDRNQVLDILTDEEYRFSRHVILQLTGDIRDYIQSKTCKSHSIPAHIQVISWIRGCHFTGRHLRHFLMSFSKSKDNDLNQNIGKNPTFYMSPFSPERLTRTKNL